MALNLISKLKQFTKQISQKATKTLQEKQRKNFLTNISSKYNIQGQRLAKLGQLIENEYINSAKTKSRDEILKEEENFSKEYKEFKSYASKNPANFIADSIINEVNRIYSINKGKKSVARIFYELKKDQEFNTGFRYNKIKNRYEANINSTTNDIRDLAILKNQRKIEYEKSGVSQEDYANGKLTTSTKQTIKRGIMFDLHYFGQLFTQDLKNYGFKISYNGFDETLRNKYNFSNSSILRKKDLPKDYRNKPSSLDLICT